MQYVERAVSGRSCCVRCKEPIPKDALRGVSVNGREKHYFCKICAKNVLYELLAELSGRKPTGERDNAA